ncbi:hypothetical protein BT63DRAFT_231884 [Microthyrium microscopicum]|uniref:Uncharacterized protein n=1 Tax=Microthyrium microscopicum TaxID=703497 RepID=A0A6A6UH46_9PEZI|nr:hypothetical protein BT63DRAFT_231884 [Microthyrium microscopicum]
MDSRPFRLRGFAVQRDENAVNLPSQKNKTLHQRNKSTPALSSLVSSNALSTNPARRAAFADVSNTHNVANGQGDLNGKAKKTLLDVKPIRTTQKEALALKPLESVDINTKVKTLLRPAQKPLGANIHKALPAAPVNSNIVAAPQNHITTDVAPVRKTLIKRHTTIFRETSIGSTAAPAVSSHETKAVVTEDIQQASPANLPTSEASQPEDIEPLSIAHNLPAPLLTVEPSLSSALIKSEKTESTLQPLISSITSSVASILPPLEYFAPIEPLYLDQNIEPELYLPALESQVRHSIPPALDEQALVPSAITELEEYWDEEEDEYFDAEGCVTARSLREMSADNTTNVTVVVSNPRATDRTERELMAAKDWVERNGFIDMSEDEAWDMTMVAEYSDEIFSYMRDLEAKLEPSAHYMDLQAEIQWSMRSVLIDWVVQVHARFGLLPETLFLAVNCIDRFLSVKVVSLAKLQLVGATAIYVAAKYEEINCPSVGEIQYMVDNSYTVEEILKAERFMLTMLKFEMGWPGPMSFLRRISKADDYCVETRTVAKYFLEVSLMDERFVGCVPSFIAAGAHCLARLMLGKGDWGAAHTHFSQYTYQQLLPLLRVLMDCCEQPRSHHGAVFDKYTDRKYKRVSTFVESKIISGFELDAAVRENTWRRPIDGVC